MLDVEMGQERNNKVQNCVTTEEVTEKPTVVITQSLLLARELKKVPLGEWENLMETKNLLQINQI